MSLREEAARSLQGAWLLFLDRPQGLRELDTSLTGFWRSFGAIVLILPLYLFAALVERQVLADASAVDAAAFWTARGLALAVNWLAMPLLLGLAARPLGIAATYVPFIVARNWASVISAVPFAIAAGFLSFGELGQEIAGILTLAALILVLRYMYIIARRALDVGMGFAIAITAIDFLLSLVIDAAIGRLFGLQ